MYKLLIAEDEKIIRNGLAKGIEWERAGFEVVFLAENGQKAIDYIRKNPVDAVMLDIRMPVLDGLQVAEILSKEYPDIKIVILSGYASFSYAQQAIRCGVSEYLLKPVKNDDILATMSRIRQKIEQERSEAESFSSEPELLAVKGIKIAGIILRAKNYIDKNYMHALSLTDMSDYLQMNDTYFSMLFKSEMGITFKDYLTAVRITKAKSLLVNEEIKINKVAEMVGYGDYRSFCKIFRRETGSSPSEYREKYRVIPE
ncbi:MAG: response regulator [Ruminococcaceae bacterium]|nr:response regulator [Oscillospiraceae bacterium]